MSKSIPSIQKYMTSSPHSIGKEQSIQKADEMMRKLGIRHLPILEGGKLIGLVSDRDIKMIEGFKDVDAKKLKLADMSITDVFTVSPSTPLDEVCATMAENKYGSAVVMDNEHLVGIFTWVDALRAMTDLLNTRLKK